MWSFRVVGAVNGERGEVRREKVETNKFFYGPVRVRPEKGVELAVGERDGRFDGGKERRERSGRAVGTGLTGNWDLGESKSGEGREVQRYL